MFKKKSLNLLIIINVIVLILLSTSSKGQDFLSDMENVNNKNIKFGLIPRAKGARIMSISVVEPTEAVYLSSLRDVDDLNKLLDIMNEDETKDWAINVIMCAIFKGDAAELLKSKKDLSFWRKEQKLEDIHLWKKSILNLSEN